MIKRFFTLWGLFFCFNSVVFSQTFPTGFSTTDIGSGWVNPTVATFTPDGLKLFVTEKRGQVYVCNRNGSGAYIKQATPVLNIEEEVGNWRDFGMLGFALDPNFATNGYIYVMYVVDRHHLLYYGTPNYNPATNEYLNATIGRITRYQTSTVAGNLIANPASRTILIGETKQTGIPITYESHGTGALEFAADGTLLASAGDGASYSSTDGGSASETYYAQALADGIIRPEENVGAFRAQMLNSLSGKLLRINPANGDGIPSNPFYDPAAPRSAKSRVWALGFRNPFRFTIKPGTGSTNSATGDIGEIYVGDVGYSTWEELNIIDGAGVNCGWPLYEGLTQLNDYYNLTTQNKDEPNPLYNGGSCNRPYFRFKELLKQATADNIKTIYNPCNSSVAIGTGNRYFHLRPSLDWHHTANNARVGIFSGNNAAEATIGTAQSGVTGSPFKGNTSVAGCWYTGTVYPANYRNTFFQADYGAGWLKNFDVDFVDKVQSVQNFGSGFAAIVSVAQNPLDGILVYVDYWFGYVRNINYGGNQLPVVLMSPDKTFGPTDLNVAFNSSSSYDPDGTIVSRLWDFGDGQTSTGTNPTHNFTAPPATPTKYVVKLTLTDNSGGTSVDSIIISVNNTPPVVNITSPVKNSLYTIGSDTAYTCSATVTDAEHTPGQLKYAWQTILKHNTHQHPEPIDTTRNTNTTISRIGCNGDTYYWEFRLTVTDPAGLSTTDSSFIYPTVIPSISIVSNQGTTICSGAQVTFTATTTNGGTSPSYQWKLNGNNVGTNSNQYQNSSLANNDIVSCVLTSNAQCANPAIVTSNAITITVTTSVTPSVNITANTDNIICSGTQVTFAANPTNGGESPSYQWKLNGSNVGSNSSQYQNISLVNGDIVTCVLTSSATCATPTSITSNAITMTVTAQVIPSVSIAATPGSTICSGTQVTFTATSTNGGTPPSYQWKLNGNNVGTNSNLYQNSGLVNGDIVTCVLTSSFACANPATATSNAITMTVTTSVTPIISISANPGNTICAGTQVTFNATPANEGSNPSYQWKRNGSNVGTNSPQYQSISFVNGDIITCVLTSNANCANPATVTSNAFTMAVTASVTPSVTIGVNPGNTICAGTQVIFTANPTNGGSPPTYQWKLNGNNVGTNNNQYQNAGLLNGDIVTCVMTSSLACANLSTATSNAITMAITALVIPSVSIAANTGSAICAGTQVTFTATPTNGGSPPTYQWKLNGNNIGTNSSQYQNSNLANGDIVGCVMTSSLVCANPATSTSNIITMAVTTSVTPSVSIGAIPGNTICAGTQVTFNATPANEGSNPSYQWKRNGSNVGTNSPQYQSIGFANGDIITCVITSNANCASPTTATSNAITMTVNAIVTPSVSIAANPGDTICAGTLVTFTATPTNEGVSPSYQWKLDGNNVGTNSNHYQNIGLANGDIVTCILTSNANCTSSATATSNAITMTVNTIVTPSVSIAANPGSIICAGTQVTFTATPTNEGPAPSYQWKLDGNNVGTNSSQYQNSGLVNGDIVTCVMTSTANCTTTATATSNAIAITVNAIVTPSVSIASSLGNSICSGTLIIFFATPINGGSIPSYQWKLNGNNVSGIGSQYPTSGLIDGDIVTCEITSNANCANPATSISNVITMAVTPIVTPSINIAADPGSVICKGTQVTFTATPTNGGPTPSYQWKLNGNNVGTNDNQYQNANLMDGDVVTCILTSNASCTSQSTVTSNIITMVVTASVTPSVNIVADPGNTICLGTQVTFTATPTNEGSAPLYQWKLNGNNAGTNNSQYQNASLMDGDIVTCDITSNAGCANPIEATSNIITITANAIATPSISIAADPGNTICSGTEVKFIATPTSGGASPSYQWKINGNNVGTNNDHYQNASLKNGDIVTCMLTSSLSCATSATSISNAITMTVNALITPSVSIAANTGTTICSGTEVTFTAIPTNGGSAPSYQWKLNGNNVGTNSDQYQNASLMNGDIVTCVLSGNAGCTIPSMVISNAITMTVNTIVTPSVNISADPGNTICSGTQETFTATPINGGASPSYQWKLNGNNVGINIDHYQSAGLENGDILTCLMTSNAVCASTFPVTSNQLAVTVNKPPSILVSPGNQSTTMGSNTEFNVIASGNGLTYQWRKEGINIPSATNSTYSIANVAIEDGGNYDVVVSGSCPPPVTSNMAILTVNVITTQPTNQTVCSGGNASFNVVTIGSTLTYQWQVSSGSSPFIDIVGAKTPVLNLNAVTNSLNGNQYRCVISGILSSNAGILKVNPLPVVNLTLPFDTLYQNSAIQTLSGGSPAGGLYSGNGVSAGKFNPVINQQGKYLVEYKYTDANGCLSMASDEFAIIAPDIGVNVYPNPALNGVLTIVTSPDLVGSNVTAFNSFGQIISSWNIGGRMTTYHLRWPSGIYMLHFSQGKRTVSKRFIITR